MKQALSKIFRVQPWRRRKQLHFLLLKEQLWYLSCSVFCEPPERETEIELNWIIERPRSGSPHACCCCSIAISSHFTTLGVEGGELHVLWSILVEVCCSSMPGDIHACNLILRWNAQQFEPAEENEERDHGGRYPACNDQHLNDLSC